VEISDHGDDSRRGMISELASRRQAMRRRIAVVLLILNSGYIAVFFPRFFAASKLFDATSHESPVWTETLTLALRRPFQDERRLSNS
jgi:hypothetical protein